MIWKIAGKPLENDQSIILSIAAPNLFKLGTTLWARIKSNLWNWKPVEKLQFSLTTCSCNKLTSVIVGGDVLSVNLYNISVKWLVIVACLMVGVAYMLC